MNFYEEEMVVRRLYAVFRERSRDHIFINPRRESDSLVFVLEGSVEIESKESVIRLAEGEAVYLPEGLSTRSVHLSEYNKTINFFFDTIEGGFGSRALRFKYNALALMAARELGEVLKLEGALDTNYLRYNFHKIIFHLTADKVIDKKYLKIHSLMLELETHYSENLSLADYARRYLMSESSLRSLFREYTGKSVIKYRNLVRLRRARELISDGTPVGEAALAVGFSSASFYCRLVKRYATSGGTENED